MRQFIRTLCVALVTLQLATLPASAGSASRAFAAPDRSEQSLIAEASGVVKITEQSASGEAGAVRVSCGGDLAY